MRNATGRKVESGGGGGWSLCPQIIIAIVSRHRKLVCISAILFFIVLYIEFISYHLNTWSWPKYTLIHKEPLTPAKILEGGELGKPLDLRDTNVLRILLVADPQLIGEEERKWWQGGHVAMADADRYLRMNFGLAKQHVDPNIVVFLGDLTNEGFKAYDAQYRRYYKRFANVFQIPKKGDPSPVEYLYLPGDNDIGGEDGPIDHIKLKWFNITFGDYHEPFRIKEHGWDVEFLKIWTLDLKKTHANRPRPSPSSHSPNPNIAAPPKTEILISHMPVLKYTSTSIEEIVDRLNPSLILSAHGHHSRLYTYDKVEKSGVSYEQNFLGRSTDGGGRMKKKFNENENASRMLYEIEVPTCSYRMGVPEMGFGVLELYKNGTMEYSVLWLQSRFIYLYAYGVLYILLILFKLWLARWILIKLWQRFISRDHHHRFDTLPMVMTGTSSTRRSPD